MKTFDWSGRKPDSLLPPDLRASANAIAAMTRELERTQWLPTTAIETMQLQQLQTLARHFEEKSPVFRARLRAAGLTANDLHTWDALRRLPLLTRRDLQALPVLADADVPAAHHPLETMGTSGSTGEPVTVRRTSVTALFWHAITMRELFWHQAPFDRRFTAIRATNATEATLPDWGQPVNLLFDTGAAQVLPITADARQLVKWLLQFQPNILLVYPNVLDAIETLCRREHISLPALDLIRTVGETLSPRIRDAAAETFRCKVIDNYSSQELGIVAVQCPESALYHVMDESVIVEVLDADGHECAQGQIGRAVITDLRNMATPLIRYDIGDYVEAGGSCPCGRGLHTLKRIAGRERNLIVMPDGTRHWPLVGFSQFRTVAPVVQYQLVQESRDAIDVRLVLERAMTAEEETALRGVIQGALGHPFELKFTIVEGALPPGPNGKFEEFVCRVQS